jgi:hypothetical protein
VIAETSDQQPTVDRKSLAQLAAEAAEESSTKGLGCPECGCRDFRVVYTRGRDDRIERRRACRHCGRRVTTHERLIG